MGMDYSAAAAKLRAMRGRCLSNADFERLVQIGSVREICAYLKATDAYGEIFADMDENTAHRGEIEMRLNSGFFDEYERLYSFMDRDRREVLRYWFTRREINLLTAGLQHVFTHENLQKESMRVGLNPFFDRHSGINIDALVTSKTIGDLAAACENTPYYDILKRAEEAQSDFFSIAMMLDGRYYESLWRTKDKFLDKDEREVFAELVGSIIDMLNIMWIYRGKKYFGFDPKLIYTYMLPVRYRLTQEQLTEMVNAPEPEKLVQAVTQTKYARLFEKCGEGYFVEEIYHSEIYDISRRIFRNYPKTMAAVFAYLHLKEYEINAVTMIIEGVRYQHEPVAIRKHINISGREA